VKKYKSDPSVEPPINKSQKKNIKQPTFAYNTPYFGKLLGPHILMQHKFPLIFDFLA
jgi:hypothetical protein